MFAPLTACGRPAPPAPRTVAVTRPAGTWQGRGDSTIGFPSESGQFRITWETHGEQPAGAGRFRLTVHSAVSGRAMEVLVDQQGEQRGSADFADLPRVYDFMIASANVDWTVSVEEVIVTTQAQ